MDKKLYVVGTPIGNFNDITLRALEVLKDVDIIACEDTRVTQKLLHHFDIKNKRLIAYHNFNEKQSTKGIIDLINKGNSIALVSDAGMPMIADPGFNLVSESITSNINYEIIPGVSALTTAISAAALGTEFTFLGFGKQKKEQLVNQIKSLTEGTYVFFVAPHKIEFLLETIDKHCPDHDIFVGREMTKIYQSFYYGDAKSVLEQIKDNLKGEMTLVLKIEKQKKEKINKYKRED